MEDKLKYKNITVKESIGKIVENVYFNDDEMLVSFTDKTFYYIVKEYYGVCTDLNRVELTFEKILMNVTFNYGSTIPKYDAFTYFLVESGIILKSDLDEYSMIKAESLLEKNKLNELEQYKKLKAKYEGSSD